MARAGSKPSWLERLVTPVGNLTELRDAGGGAAAGGRRARVGFSSDSSDSSFFFSSIRRLFIRFIDSSLFSLCFHTFEGMNLEADESDESDESVRIHLFISAEMKTR